jgi:hypothetical protein
MQEERGVPGPPRPARKVVQIAAMPSASRAGWAARRRQEPDQASAAAGDAAAAAEAARFACSLSMEGVKARMLGLSPTEALQASRCPQVPRGFESLQQYGELWLALLLEELRASMQQVRGVFCLSYHVPGVMRPQKFPIKCCARCCQLPYAPVRPLE